MAEVATQGRDQDRPAKLRRLLICTGPCCNNNGAAEALLKELRARLSETKTDSETIGEASCVRRSCLGKCIGEPLAYVDPDGVWYHQLSCENVLTILREHVLHRRPVSPLVLEED
jgi:(2Fe-2S) ferredoxin